jgi:hypothetical protein
MAVPLAGSASSSAETALASPLVLTPSGACRMTLNPAVGLAEARWSRPAEATAAGVVARAGVAAAANEATSASASTASPGSDGGRSLRRDRRHVRAVVNISLLRSPVVTTGTESQERPLRIARKGDVFWEPQRGIQERQQASVPSVRSRWYPPRWR